MEKQRKIIHIDMDCFFAAVEERDNPALKGKPVAIGGFRGNRGVLCTANYEARNYGVHSAMPTAMALKKCPSLVLVRPHFEKYKEVSEQVFKIFKQYTDIVQGVSLDEAYLDVSESEMHNNLAVKMAVDIREKIKIKTGVTASAGISYNKLLAKIASDLNKPNGQFTITPWDADKIIPHFPVSKINGVGKVTQEKMKKLGLETFSDLQKLSKLQLINSFGNFGPTLYNYCRGIDLREVKTEWVRKSVSTEHTFAEDILDSKILEEKLKSIYHELMERLEKYQDRTIKTLFTKIKYKDFQQTTIEKSGLDLSWESFLQLYQERYENDRNVRLLGVGVKFENPEGSSFQQSFLI